MPEKDKKKKVKKRKKENLSILMAGGGCWKNSSPAQTHTTAFHDYS